MEVRAAAARFAEVWQECWVSENVEAITALYAEDCVHRSMPFREPHSGKQAFADYLRWSFADEHAASVRFSTPIVDGDRAAIEFWVTFDGGGTLAGCVFARFRDGLVIETRDYWHPAEETLDNPGFLAAGHGEQA
jgi:ketosteroid isomerase-like protein